MKQAEQYLSWYQQTTVAEERQAIVAEYRALPETMPADERAEARAYMSRVLKPNIDENVRALEILTEKPEMILARKGKVTYEGKEYVFGDWVTIADYCRLYNFKAARVQNWIDRAIIPKEKVVVIGELNNLKLLKNEPYQP